MRLHHHQHSNYCQLPHTEHCQEHLHIAVLMNVNCANLQIAFQGNVQIEGETDKILYLEPLCYLFLNMPHGVHIHIVCEITDMLNDYCNHYAIIQLVMQHEQFSVNEWFLEPKQGKDVLKSVSPNMCRLLQTSKNLSKVQYNHVQCLF